MMSSSAWNEVTPFSTVMSLPTTTHLCMYGHLQITARHMKWGVRWKVLTHTGTNNSKSVSKSIGKSNNSKDAQSFIESFSLLFWFYRPGTLLINLVFNSNSSRQMWSLKNTLYSTCSTPNCRHRVWEKPVNTVECFISQEPHLFFFFVGGDQH